MDHLEKRLRVVEGGRDYAFTEVEELFLVPKHGHSQVQISLDIDAGCALLLHIYYIFVGAQMV